MKHALNYCKRFYCISSVAHAEMFFNTAAEFGLMNSNRLWVVNEQALKASNAPIGTVHFTHGL